MRRLVFLCSLLGLLATPFLAADPAAIAAKPLFRDPVFDGAADPVVIWNPSVQRWWMFYTNRRANAAGLAGSLDIEPNDVPNDAHTVVYRITRS